MTSIVASTGVGSPRRCLHPLFDRGRARGYPSGRDDRASDPMSKGRGQASENPIAQLIAAVAKAGYEQNDGQNYV